jgi:hypothetical protein
MNSCSKDRRWLRRCDLISLVATGITANKLGGVVVSPVLTYCGLSSLFSLYIQFRLSQFIGQIDLIFIG